MYINRRDGRAKLSPITEQMLKINESSLIAPFYDSLKHEQQVSTWIYELYAKARDLKDYSSEAFLKWFVDEQVEEEQEFIDLIARFELVKDCGDGLYRFNDLLEEKGKI